MSENPYRYQIPGNAYVGNEELRARVIDGMVSGGEHFAVVGGRRCGKTSFLNIVERDLSDHADHRRFVFVAMRATALDEVSPSGLFRDMLISLTQDLPGTRWRTYFRETDPYAAFKTGLTESLGKALRKRYGREWRAVLLIDEIDSLASRLRETGHGDTFFGNLRDLVSDEEKTRNNWRLVVTGASGDMSGVIRHGSPLWNVLAKVRLRVLRDRDVEQLIDVGFKGKIGTRARARLIQLTGRHPYLLQGSLHTLWSRSPDRVAAEHVEWAANSFRREHEDDFRRWFDAFDPVARAVYGYLSASARGTATWGELRASVLRRGVESLTPGEIKDALHLLSTHGVAEGMHIADSDDTEYRICGTMFRDWFYSHAPVIKDEVVGILEELEERLEVLGLSRADRKVTQQLLARTKRILSGDNLGDFGKIKKNSSDTLRQLWNVIEGAKGIASVADVLLKLAPYFDKAAEWIRNLPL